MEDEEFALDLTPGEEEMERLARLEAEVDVYSAVDRYMHSVN